ncbi:MAG: hypothetical protein JJU11_07970 [Candidatus Sumerlaeia bacterium]|nr:hypothetical protein [Candidatus Sumerlaeia bacterium]
MRNFNPLAPTYPFFACILLVFLGGCATNKSLQELEQRLVASNNRISQELRNEISTHRSRTDESIGKVQGDLQEFRSNQGNQNTQLANQISQARSELASDISSRDASQTRARQQLEDQLENRLTESVSRMRTELNDMRTQLQADLERIDRRLSEDLASTRSELNQRMDHETGLLNSEIDIIRQESKDAHGQARRLTAAMRSALHRQRQVVLEQFQTLDGLAQTFEEILDPQAEGRRPENATTMFQQALNSHKIAAEQDDVDKFVEALNYYKKGLALMPEYVPGHYNSASILLELDRPNDAIIHLEQVLSLEPNGRYSSTVRRILQDLGQ